LEIFFLMPTVLYAFILCMVSKFRSCECKWPHLRSRTPVECVNPKSRGGINRAPQLEQRHRPKCKVQCRLIVLGTVWQTIQSIQLLLYVPPALTYQTSVFCPQSVFMCFVWFSQ
jgi:hypothetical protein